MTVSSSEIPQYLLVLKEVEVPYISFPKEALSSKSFFCVHYAFVYNDGIVCIILLLYTEKNMCFSGIFQTHIERTGRYHAWGKQK